MILENVGQVLLYDYLSTCLFVTEFEILKHAQKQFKLPNAINDIVAQKQ